MFDLDANLDQVIKCTDLMKKYRLLELTGDLARKFIHELSAINDSFHDQITEGIDENIEVSDIRVDYVRLIATTDNRGLK